jgi:hypothetical protein
MFIKSLTIGPAIEFAGLFIYRAAIGVVVITSGSNKEEPPDP